jgi:hypothetical protein
MAFIQDSLAPEQLAQRMENYHIPLVDIQNGELVPYSDLASPQGSMLKGGRSAGFEFTHDGKTYVIEDLYCPTPECDCLAVDLFFMRYQETDEEIAITPLFMVQRKFFSEARDFHQRYHIEQAEAGALLDAWEAANPDILEELKQRYSNIRRIARRCMESWKTEQVIQMVKR